jgi:tetratricopeptide (TPR) repeat protein
LRTPRSFAALAQLCALASSLAACAASSDSAPPEATTFHAALRSASAGALACDRDAARCVPLTASTPLEEGARIETPGRARVSLEVGALRVELAPGASLVLGSGDSPLRLVRGAATLSNATPSAELPPVALLDRTLELDGARPSTVALLAASADRGTVSVHNGRVSLSGEGFAALELGAGDSLPVALGVPSELRDLYRGAASAVGVAEMGAPSDDGSAERPSGPTRGLGTVTARVPGTSDIVGGVRIQRHHVKVTLKDGFARTELEEEMANDTAQVLEGRYVFPLPSDASISRLALWVGNELVEGEMVERARANRIFKGIVDDTVRPRDPALLEWVKGGEVSLKIFPLPARGSRKVVLAYGQALAAAGDRVRYVYPLSLGADRSTRLDELSITVVAEDAGGVLDVATPGFETSLTTRGERAETTYFARDFQPSSDFVLTYRRDPGPAARLTTFVPKADELAPLAGGNDDGNEAHPGYAAVRLRAELPEGAALPERRALDRVLVLDASQSQSPETFAAEARLATALVTHLEPEERFVVLVCDTACAAFPEDGFARPDAPTLSALRAFLDASPLGGATDLAGALLAGAARLRDSERGQLVVLGDGAATAGELTADAIAERVRDGLAGRSVDLRLLGAGRSIDAARLSALASNLGGTFEPVATAGSLAERAESIALALRRPVITGARVELGAAFRDVFPRQLPNLRLGQEITVVARLAPGAEPGSARLVGSLGKEPYAVETRLGGPALGLAETPLVSRLWAEAKIGELETAGGDIGATVVELSRRFHVMSRRTALLVLENERMFAEFGVERRAAKSPLLRGDDLPSETPRTASFGSSGAQKPADSGPLHALGGSSPVESDDPMSARGNLWGSDLGDSFGQGGLGLSGVGEGGGGRGDGIGLGDVGTLGHGAGSASNGTGSGFGAGHGRLGGSHKSSSPQVRMGATSVSGRLPPEVIQRIVRQNFGRFRFCYEQALRKNPELSGRISVRFMIGRDGSVSSASAEGMPDAEMNACVARSFGGLAFPQPEGGVVTVVYPILFSPEGGSGSSSANNPPAPGSTWTNPVRTWTTSAPWEPSGPSVVHGPLARSFVNLGRESVDKLARAVDEDPLRRPRHEALVRALLTRGRFAEALESARRFAELDPDEPRARELYAFALATTGDGEATARAMGSLAETSASSASVQLRAARAYDAVGDDTRACAHFRAALALRSSDETQYEALRCRARTGEERSGVLASAQSLPTPGPLVSKLVSELGAGRLPEGGAAKKGALEARVTCDVGVERCPTVVVIGPTGTVVCPWAPAATRSERGLASMGVNSSGSYRTVLVGGEPGARGTVELTALGVAKSFPFENAGTFVPIATTTVSGL